MSSMEDAASQLSKRNENFNLERRVSSMEEAFSQLSKENENLKKEIFVYDIYNSVKKSFSNFILNKFSQILM